MLQKVCCLGGEMVILIPVRTMATSYAGIMFDETIPGLGENGIFLPFCVKKYICTQEEKMLHRIKIKLRFCEMSQIAYVRKLQCKKQCKN